jgi:RNA polymerase sigma-70 factor, ECF subfamily
MTNHDKSNAGWNSFDALLQAARAGDRDSINRIICECRDYLLLVANQELDQELQGKMGASDLVQQTIAEIPAHLKQFRGNSRDEFLGWLRQALHNDLRDARRRYKTSQQRDVSRERELEDSAGVQLSLPDPVVTPAAQAILNEQSQILNAAMVQLPPIQQQIIQLRNWSQLSFVEIAEQLNLSPDAARKSWYRAIIKLQELLRPQFESSVLPKADGAADDKESEDES